MCCYVIITFRSMLWTLLSITLWVALLSCAFSTKWMISAPLSHGGNSNSSDNEMHKTIGLFSTCTVTEYDNGGMFETCNFSALSIDGIASPYWIACCFFIGFALLILTAVAIFSCGALCFRSLGRKSIYSVSGLLQAVSGFLLIFPLVLFPLGWGSELVRHDCGHSGIFNPGTCGIGMAYLGVLGCLFCAFGLSILSKYADASLRCRKIEHDIDHGKNPICGGF